MVGAGRARRTAALVLAGVALVVVGGAALAARPAGTAGTLRISDATVVEGNRGFASLIFTVRLSGPAESSRVKVTYSTSNGTARAPADYVAASGTLRLGNRARTRRLAVKVVGDRLDERNETLLVKLSDASGARIVDGSARGTIRDNDGAAVNRTTIAAAGDIACDPEDESFNGGRGEDLECRQRATSDRLVGAGYAAVLALGDLQYGDADFEAFRASYDPSWGRVKAITRPVPGDHEYDDRGAAGYFRYFGSAAGDPEKGYYSFELGGWHVIALNSNCSKVGGCEAGSPQEQWLRADLAAHGSARCTLAFWHHPRFSSGRHGNYPEYTAFWRALYEANAELVLSGDDHDYERFRPQTPGGALNTARGIRQFVVGTGGKSVRPFSTVRPNSEVRDHASLGVLELTLGRTGYSWRFVPAVGFFSDSGSGSCH